MGATLLFRTHLTKDYPQLLSRFRESHPEAEILELSEDSRLEEHLPAADVLVSAPVTEETLDRAEKLKLHIIPFAGVNRAPLHWYRERGVMLASSHGNAPTVAERAVALALAAAGRVVEFDQDLRHGLWHRNRAAGRPFDLWRSLSGAKTAFLGAGAIAEECARLLRPLVGRITAFRRSSTGRTPEPFDGVTTDLAEAVDGAQLIIAALPLTKETRGILRTEHFRAADYPVFVNVSRAEIVQEQLLFSALTEGIVSAAGLDVWYRYPDPFWSRELPSDLPFSELTNVVLSPHAGSHAEEGKIGQLRGAMELLDRYLAGEPVPGRVDLQRGY